MRKVLGFFFVLMLACALPGLAFAEKMQVAVGVAPVEHFAKKIGGELVQTTLLVPAGADAHTYEPKPSQMRALSRVALCLTTGLEFEHAWEARLKGANSKMLMVRTDAGLKKLPMPEGHEGHEDQGHGRAAKAGHDHHEELDPHVWVSPAQVRQMAATIATAFAKADPAHAKAYAANLAAFQKEIDALDAQIKALFAGVPADKRAFLVFHPAWGYFARDYGLTQTSIEFEGKEPSPRRLAAIVNQAKAKGAKAIFVQPQMSQRAAGTIAKAVGAKLVVADPLAEDWAANLLQVARGFREALQ
jgi:zinc transport system substrate-binding protein